tara:strand:- start:5707 stop:6780 length:1074 start_codon:yes stop_codon:yes gene_type:complete
MKSYIKFLIKLYTNSFIKVFFIFSVIILITNILENYDFFSEYSFNIAYIAFLSFLNTPTTIYDIFPFIFLIATQVFFIKLIDKNELGIFKYSGLTNNNLIKIIATYTFALSLFIVVVFYNISAILKQSYLVIKNNYSNDAKYLAVVTENGLWMKDEINQKINIINANKINNEFLLDVSITQFNKSFDILRVIKSDKINISRMTWEIFNPNILENGKVTTLDEMILQSNFDLRKINNLFSNLSSLNMVQLFTLRKNYKLLNYSIIEIDSQLYKILTYPIYLTLITIFSSIIMFNIKYQKSSLFKIIFGILLSVIIFYINYFFNILGVSEKIPLLISIFLPLTILTIINFTYIIRLNEK